MQKSVKEIKSEIMEIIHNIIKKHWLIYTLITFLPTIWFSLILNYFGVSWKLIVDVNGIKALTKMGKTATFILVVLVLLIAVFNNYYSSKTEVNKLAILQGENIFYKEISNSVDKICNKKYNQLVETMVSISQGKQTIPNIVTNPSNQLRSILEQIIGCLCIFMYQSNEKYGFKDFSVVLVYNYPQINNKWIWLNGTDEKESSLDELTDLKSKSTFNYLMGNTKPYYFNNSKENAKINEQYRYDSQDQMNADNGKPVGSIFCYKIHIKKSNEIFVNAMLSISTNQKRFVPDENKARISNARDNILKIVKDHFGKRIGIELSLLYLEEIDDLIKNKKESA